MAWAAGKGQWKGVARLHTYQEGRDEHVRAASRSNAESHVVVQSPEAARPGGIAWSDTHAVLKQSVV